MPASSDVPASSERDVRRWRQYLADEIAEAAVYRDLASRRSGEEREILLALAEAEGRHAAHWQELLGDQVGKPRRGDIRTRMLGLLARTFGSVFVLALAQRAEARSPYEADADATPAMAADERIHGEVVRGLAARGRNRLRRGLRSARRDRDTRPGLSAELQVLSNTKRRGVVGPEPRTFAYDEMRRLIELNPEFEKLFVARGLRHPQPEVGWPKRP